MLWSKTVSKYFTHTHTLAHRAVPPGVGGGRGGGGSASRLELAGTRTAGWPPEPPVQGLGWPRLKFINKILMDSTQTTITSSMTGYENSQTQNRVKALGLHPKKTQSAPSLNFWCPNGTHKSTNFIIEVFPDLQFCIFTPIEIWKKIRNLDRGRKNAYVTLNNNNNKTTIRNANISPQQSQQMIRFRIRQRCQHCSMMFDDR